MKNVKIKNNIVSYQDLIVWQKSMDLVVAVYKLTDKYPKSELYTLTSETRRSVISIPSNIAEGRRRGSKKDYRRFLLIAFGSGAELETQIAIAKRLIFGKDLDFSEVDLLLGEVMKMLNRMVSNLSTS